MTTVSFTKNKFFQIVIFLLTFSGNSFSQDVTAFLDFQDYLQVFDRGFLRKAESLPVASYKIGGNSIAYIDHKNDFKIYYDGQVIPLVNAADFSYFVTDNLTAFRVGDVLYAFDKGQKKTLCYYTSIMAVNDSILAYFDESLSSLNIYYNESVIVAEDALLSRPKSIKTGSNIVAWVNQSNIFTVFYKGVPYKLDNIPPVTYEAGCDILAWVDEYERRFRLFYKGDTAMIEEFLPDSFKLGFGIMAYVDYNGNFNIFDDGAIKRIIPNRPAFFFVKGNVIVYSYNNTFNIYYKGEITTLQNRTPDDFQLGNDGIAWLDDSGRLMLFHKGKTYPVSYETINKYYLNGNTLKYEVGVNTVYVFYNGKNY
jgi:hypothetical protein